MGDPNDFGRGRRAKPIPRTIRLLAMDDKTGVRMMGKQGFVHNVHPKDAAYAKKSGWLKSKPTPREAGNG